MKQRLILISGGIGSGKSAVSAALQTRGVMVIDADGIGHQVLQPGHSAYAGVSEHWPEVIQADGSVDRRALGRIVFADPAALDILEALTHSAIRAEIRRLVLESPDTPLIAVELPILSDFLGDGWTRVVVDVSDELRRIRLRGRGMDDDEIDQRMVVQPSREEWLESADAVIDNSADLSTLDAGVDELLRSIDS